MNYIMSYICAHRAILGSEIDDCINLQLFKEIRNQKVSIYEPCRYLYPELIATLYYIDQFCLEIALPK